MSNRKLYPSNAQHRFFFWAAISCCLVGWGMALLGYRFWVSFEWYEWAFLLLGGPAYFVYITIYFARQSPTEPIEEQYSMVIADIENMGKQLTTLADFLKTERTKVEESAAVVKRLQDEKIQLEPVVTAQRETVNAILAAHAKTTASHAWKERAIGFVSGVLTSLLATMLFEFFVRSQK